MEIIALHPNCTYEIHKVAKKDYLATLQKLVGGYIEPVQPKIAVGGRHFIYVNEEAELKSLPPNYYASRIMEKLGYNLFTFMFCTPRGVVVLCGTDEEYREKGLAKETVALVKAMHTLVLKENEEQEDEECPVEEEETPKKRDASPLRK